MAAPNKSKSGTGALTPMTDDWGFDAPETALDDTDEKRKKSISKTKQWKEFVVFARQRQELYRKQTPGGVLYSNMPQADNAFYSTVGNAVMEEYETLINFIEGGGASG